MQEVKKIANTLREHAGKLTEAADLLDGQRKAPHRVVSASVRRKMSIAQKQRWAVVHSSKKAA